MASLEMLDKENDLSFDISILDSIPLNNSATVYGQRFLFLRRTSNPRRMLNTWNHTEAQTFCNPPFHETNRESLSTKFVPKKTADSTKWAICIFTDWVQERNRCPSALTNCPADLLTSQKSPVVTMGKSMATPSHYWMAAFLTEVRKADGGFYSPASLRVRRQYERVSDEQQVAVSEIATCM